MGWKDDEDIWYSTTASSSTCTGNTYVFTNANACSTTASNVSWYYYEPRVRRIWIEMPSFFSDETNEDFAALLNVQLRGRCGRITAIVKGKVCITDPNDEIRAFNDAIILLKSLSDEADARAIDEWVEAHRAEGR